VSHAHHFLSRLDRVSRPHVELALSLYRDHELLSYILESVRIPDDAERIAISLDHPDQGPFLVITREGRFVTCLGAGMRADGLPIVTRGQVDGITNRMRSHRARQEACDKLVGKEGELGDLMERVIDAGPEFSREEFMALASVQPFVARDFFVLLLEITRDCYQSRDTLLKILRRTNRIKPHRHPALHGYWKQFWATGHLALLATLGGRDALGDIPVRERPIEASIATCTIRQGVGSLALKGAWSIAKIGKPLVGYFKKLYVEGEHIWDMIDAAVSLTAIGLRHTKLRAEIRKALARSPQNESYATMAEGLSSFAEAALNETEEVERYHLDMGTTMIMKLSPRLPKGSPYRFERPEDVPEPLAMTMAANFENDYLDDLRNLMPLFLLLPWTVRATPEDLYLPAEVIKALHIGWKPERTMTLLAHHIRREKKHVQQRQEGPTRSGPCPCGSGKKYKRCCFDKDKAAEKTG
jgi:hypothetical protein